MEGLRVKNWAEQYYLPIITLPGVSPDFSICESIAHPLKRAFHSKRCASEGAGLYRFAKIFEQELDQEKINNVYDWYTRRLYACRVAGGQMATV